MRLNGPRAHDGHGLLCDHQAAGGLWASGYAMAIAEEPFAGGLGWLVDSACQGAWLFVSLACSTECDRVMVVKVYSRIFFF